MTAIRSLLRCMVKSTLKLIRSLISTCRKFSENIGSQIPVKLKPKLTAFKSFKSMKETLQTKLFKGHLLGLNLSYFATRKVSQVNSQKKTWMWMQVLFLGLPKSDMQKSNAMLNWESYRTSLSTNWICHIFSHPKH